MPNKFIYFLGGFYFSEEERFDQYLRYGLMLRMVFEKEKSKNLKLDEFALTTNHDRCSISTFTQIWASLNTYGIVWNSHGTEEGYPVAWNADFEEEPWRRDELMHQRILNPRALNPASKNLKFFVLLGCRLGQKRRDWLDKIPPKSVLVASEDNMYGLSSGRRFEDLSDSQKKATIDAWIKRDKCASEGQSFGCLLRYLAEDR